MRRILSAGLVSLILLSTTQQLIAGQDQSPEKTNVGIRRCLMAFATIALAFPVAMFTDLALQPKRGYQIGLDSGAAFVADAAHEQKIYQQMYQPKALDHFVFNEPRVFLQLPKLEELPLYSNDQRAHLGVYGDPSVFGLYYLSRDGDKLNARFILDVYDKVNKPFTLGRIRQDGSIEWNPPYSMIAFHDHYAPTWTSEHILHTDHSRDEVIVAIKNLKR